MTPGGFCGVSAEVEGNKMALSGEATEELDSQADLRWRSGKRAQLRQMLGLESLCKRIKVLLNAPDKVIKHAIIAACNA